MPTRVTRSQNAGSTRMASKSVRNSMTRIFEKLGVRTRTQAAVLARDHGFAPRA